jgi:tetratricopeptide (TPR) repeat protein
MLGLGCVVTGVIALGSVWPLVGGLTVVAAILSLVAMLYVGRAFFRARSAMRARRYDDAIALFEAFQAERASGSVPFLWLSLYTSDPIALSLNNIGACHLAAHRPERALTPLGDAATRDPGYALPQVNLAVAHRLLGDAERSQSHAEAARRLGFGRDPLEAALRRAVAAANTRLGASLG